MRFFQNIFFNKKLEKSLKKTVFETILRPWRFFAVQDCLIYCSLAGTETNFKAVSKIRN